MLHYDISVQSARVAHAAVLSTQLARLLNCTALIDSLSLPAATPISHALSSDPMSTNSPPSLSPEPTSAPSPLQDVGAASSGESSLAAKLGELSLTECPGKENCHPVLCDLHSAPSISGGSCCSSVWLRQALCFISITSQSVTSGHMTSHVTRMDGVVRAACDLLTQHWQSHGDIDLSPVGVPTIIKPQVSKVKSRGKRVKKTGDCMKVSSTRLVGVKAELMCARARCLLADMQAVQAQQVLTTTLADIGTQCRDHESSLVLARLHYYVGVALAQQLEEETRQEGVWFENTSSHLHKQCVEEFMTCYQLCFPMMPTILLRETCLWLGLLLTEPDHTHHFLSLSQHIALMHDTVVSLGKKLR